MNTYLALAESVRMINKGTHSLLIDYDDKLEFIGKGRSAYVFKIKGTEVVLKMFFPDFAAVAKEEALIYQALGGLEYYPSMYEAGENYLVIDHVKGSTLFQCLQKGMPITEHHLQEVDRALQLARDRGLNPSDIHLRNILITDTGAIKIIDVARYRQQKDCTQWDDLKNAFYVYYTRKYFPKKMPLVLLNTVAALYKRKMLPHYGEH